jgi:hypothetical protein
MAIKPVQQTMLHYMATTSSSLVREFGEVGFYTHDGDADVAALPVHGAKLVAQH